MQQDEKRDKETEEKGKKEFPFFCSLIPPMNRLSPLDAAIEAAESMVDVSARNRILEEAAKTQFRLGRLEDALGGLRNAPNEKTVLRRLAIDAVNRNDAESTSTILCRLIALDAESPPLAGRLAILLLGNGNVGGAMKVLRCTENPFEGGKDRYDFIVKLLEHDRFDDAQKLTEAFKDAEFRDWASLAFVKRYAALGRRTETEKAIGELSSQEKRAWAFFEGSRLFPNVGGCSGETGRPDLTMLRRAGAILETTDVDKANAEAVAIQRRIVGKALWNAGEHEAARQLLESSEAALSIIEDSFRRLRARCFLAGTLRKIGELDSVRNYLNVSVRRAAEISPARRSELLQWLAEATGSTADWTHAVREAANERDETLRSRRIADILRRFSYTAEKTSPTGTPDLDAVLLSGEEFEEWYYSPFAVDGCGC